MSRSADGSTPDGSQPDGGPGQRDARPSDDASRPEAVLSQALRVMAGGGKPAGRVEPARPPGESGLSVGQHDESDRDSTDGPWTTTNIVLAAVIVGLVIGIAAALTVLVIR